MKSKFNIVLIPITQTPRIVQTAEKISYLADEYLLGKTSFPHVTLYQFWRNGAEIPAIWDKISQLIAYVDLRFETASYVTFDEEIFWISLMPDQRELLTQLHAEVAAIIDKPIKNTFDPHMTLVNTRNKTCDVAHILQDYEVISDRFVLAIGSCDKVGQVTRIIHRN